MTKPPSRRYIGEVILRRYLIERLIGEGSFAWVYRARSREGDLAAVKILHSTQPTASMRFAREARVLQGIPENPNVARYIDHGHTGDGRPALILEYVDGITLKLGLERRPVLKEDKAVAFMTELCEAFVGLHQLGVAHRDVKPENIIMSRRGGIKLIDFGLIRDAQGILKLLEEEDPLETRVFQDELDKGVLAGTPEYMAPEQFSDSAVADISQARTDTWSDVFSLGVILYELLTGRRPFAMREVPHNRYPLELLRYLRWRIKLRDRDTPRIPEVSSALQSIVHKALRRDPRRRQPDARALMDDLLRYQKTGQGVERTDDSRTMVASISHVISTHEQQSRDNGSFDNSKSREDTSAYKLFDEKSGPEINSKDMEATSSIDDAPWKPVGREQLRLKQTPDSADNNPTGKQSPAENGRTDKLVESEDVETDVQQTGYPSQRRQQSQIERFFPESAEIWPEENLADPPPDNEPAILKAATDLPALEIEDLYEQWDFLDWDLSSKANVFADLSSEVNLADLVKKGKRFD